MKLGLVLSSGGPLGISHLGVLKRLEEEGIRPDVISGSSAGAIIGGLYSSGISVNELIDLSLSNKITEMFSDYTILGLYSNGFGAIRGNNMLNILRDKTENKNFNDLKIPFAANAVNFLTSKEIGLKRGNIAEAMRASSSIPMLFKPFKIRGKQLVDGSVSNPLPVNLAKKLGADYTLGVTFKRAMREKISMVDDPIKNLKRLALHKLDDSIFGTLKKLLNFDIIDKILKLIANDNQMINHLFKMHNEGIENRGAKESNFLIDTDLSTVSNNREQIIKKGYRRANSMIENLQIELENKRRSMSRRI